MDDVSRFRSVKQAISYCGLCGGERSSADKVLRTPISKQRNKHIQSVLVEAAKFTPQQSHELALVYEKEKQKGNSNRRRSCAEPETMNINLLRKRIRWVVYRRDLIASLSPEQVAAVALHLADIRQKLRLQHGLIRIGVLRLRVSVPDSGSA